jgi:S-(hydroxymethyl)glutathione dehydrogenase/alcohol dehydrogenase
MKAAVLSEQPGSLTVEELVVDGPRPSEVLIDVTAAGLCHSDLHFMQGKFPSPLPVVLGHESSGVVREVGRDVRYVRPGDHVVCCVSLFCGNCRQCLSGAPYRCSDTGFATRPEDAPPALRRSDGESVHQYFRLGGFAEQMLVHEHAVVKIPTEMPLDRAALLGCAVLTGTGAVFRTAAVEPGSRICVIGAGGIGLAAIQAARIAGASPIIAVDVSDEKLDLARRVGATHVVNASLTDDVVEAVRDLGGGGVDYSVEAIGTKLTSEQAFRVLDLGGTATIVGMVPYDTPIEIRGLELLADRRIQGSMMGSNQFRVDIPRLAAMYLDGRLQLDEMVSGRIGLEDINDGYDALLKGSLARTVVVF